MSLTVSVEELNKHLVCSLCNGYYRDAHTIPECMHSFCKACILKNFAERNQKGHVYCPTCNIPLGIYAANKQLIYDRNLQALLDELFPHFAEREKVEKARFDEDLKEKSRAERRQYKREYNENENEEPESHKKARLEDEEVTFKLMPAPNADHSRHPMLPALKKSTFKSKLNIRVSKVIRFVHKRLVEEMPSITPEDIDILDEKGTVLDGESDLTNLECTDQPAAEAGMVLRLYNMLYRWKESVAV